MRYNSTKKRSLEIFEDQSWIDVPGFSKKAGIRPVRRAYTYLAHLEQLGLLTRGYDAGRKLHYRITPRGLERLNWLRQPDKPDPVKTLAAQLLQAVRLSD